MFKKNTIAPEFEVSVDPEVQFERRMRRHEGQLERETGTLRRCSQYQSCFLVLKKDANIYRV